VYGYIVQDYDDSPDILVAGPDLKDAKQVTSTNPFQSNFAWGHSELIDYQSDKGRQLQGALYYPAGYEPGKKYPMIVYNYELLSQNVHRYVVPSDTSYYNNAVFTSQGYFVLEPDIVYEDLQAYIDNSAVFNVQNMTVPLLLEAGDSDGTVAWHQGIELYKIARRARKNVVMLAYIGEDHGLRQKKNQIDYQQRILAWFRHYLKDEPAEAWITNGKSFLERDAEIKRLKK
jgi:dipeptidyl aminopeptidase/acylaminoacyl peptidase